MKNEILTAINSFTLLKRMFTSLDISNDLKKSGKSIRHSEVSPYIREAFAQNAPEFDGYTRTEILVTAELMDNDGDLDTDTRTTWLYHLQGDDPADYQTRDLKAIQPVLNVVTDSNGISRLIDPPTTTDSIDIDDDITITTITPQNDPDGAYAYQTPIHSHGLSVYIDALASRNLDDANFDMFLRNGELKLTRSFTKNSVVQTTKLGHLRISNTDLTRVGLSNYDKVWVHIYDEFIIINELSPRVMNLRKHIGKLVKFKVETPTSTQGETSQTVLLKVTSVSATKAGDFLIHGYNLKRIVDDADNMKSALRQYRIDRIDFSTFVELEV